MTRRLQFPALVLLAYATAMLLVYAAITPAQTQPRTTQSTQPATTQAMIDPRDAWIGMFPRGVGGFTQHPLGAHPVYVAIAGSDFAVGTTAAPVQTIKGAWKYNPTSICLLNGDHFSAANINDLIHNGGPDPAHPFVLTGYGDPMLRPLVGGVGLAVGDGHFPKLQNVVVCGVDFDAGTQRGGGAVGFDLNHAGDHVWIEDCSFSGYSTGIRLQGQMGFDCIIIRRTRVFDSYTKAATQPTDPSPGHAQGIYTVWCNHVLIEDCLFDHCGWAHPDVFQHNAYIQYFGPNVDAGRPLPADFVFRNNIFARAGSHGMQYRSGGGVVDNNLFLCNPLALFVSGNPAIVSNNVFLDAADIDAGTPRGNGLEVQGLPGAVVTGNIFAHKHTAKGSGEAIAVNPAGQHGIPYPLMNCLLTNNIVFDWSPGKSLSFNGPVAITQSGNAFSVPYPAYADPSRDIVSYLTSIGTPGDLAAFLAVARTNRRMHYDARFTAAAVNDYVRAGFTVPVVMPPPTTNPSPLATVHSNVILITGAPAGVSSVTLHGAGMDVTVPVITQPTN